MNCVCGHPEKAHVLGGRCRVPDCACDRFQPGDTVGRTRPGWNERVTAGALAVLFAFMLGMPGLVGAADGPEPPASFARVAQAARAASIVIRIPEADDLALNVGPVNDVLPRLDDEADVADPLEARGEETLAVGVIVDPRGFALTSARAVLLVSDFEVFLLDGTKLKATLHALDRRTDVAVLKLENGPAALPYLPLAADSDRVDIGDWVITVGAPSGLEGTVTAGVITAIPTPASPSPFAGLLQTDAAMDIGNAGGPVVSLRGEVVGLATVLSGGGVGYARPSSIVRKVYLELLEKGRVTRPWLGVQVQALSAGLARAFGAPDTAGILVSDVEPNGPGARAGLRSGDIVLALDATPVSSRAQLDRVVGVHAPGRVVTLSVRRGVHEVTVPVRLGDEPDDWQLPPALARAKRLLGIEARALTPTMGVMAAHIERASPAARAGVEAGDIIREVNRRTIRTMADFRAAVRSIEPSAPVLMLVQRGGFALYVALDPTP